MGSQWEVETIAVTTHALSLSLFLYSMAGKSPEEEHPVESFGWAAKDPSGVLSPFKFSRRATGDEDVRFKVLYCGICHSDLHCIKNEWGFSTYPLVPGHEIVGTVTEVGDKVTKFSIGDRVGVGCMVGSCRTCQNCSNDLENYCSKTVATYSGTDYDGTTTYGGYSNEMVANEHFVVKFPASMPLDSGAPLLCAGITVYSPLKYYGLTKPGNKKFKNKKSKTIADELLTCHHHCVTPGTELGVVGLGGLGHLAVKFAKAFGVKVTVISASPGKKEDAVRRLGADSFLISSDADHMQAAMASMDGIVDTVSAVHPIMPLVGLLKSHGKLVMVGAPDRPLELPVFPLIVGRKLIGGSGIGGMKETQEMIDFAAENNIAADIEVIPMDYVNTAMDRLQKGDVRYRREPSTCVVAVTDFKLGGKLPSVQPLLFAA
ncbi:unnamed protein product [Thlaspi arvense]|uniref:Enoyl reductase (ER) domain-containing protein n=1 Tax=Thlaspi arvense TaxID=13288 RepID=A0AAU9RKN8_THLAR|nr:unnamed protein product [Thlaspi arvense]